MNFNKLSKIIISFGKRGVVLYILAFVLFYVIVDSDLLRVKALNHLLPSAGQWVRLAEIPEKLDNKELKEFIDYYRHVIKYMPRGAGVHGLLGFCYYYQGEYKKAVSFYKKAAHLEPRFFWSHFNLGAIYFKNGDYKKAVEPLQKAMATRSDHTLVFMKLSKIYQNIIRRTGNSDDAIQKGLDAGYGNCFALLVSSYYHLKNFPAMFRTAVYVINSNSGNKDTAYYYAGVAAYELKNYEKSAFFLQECIKRDPGHTRALRYLGLCLKALGKGQMSVGILRKAKGLPESKDPVFLKDDEIRVRIF